MPDKYMLSERYQAINEQFAEFNEKYNGAENAPAKYSFANYSGTLKNVYNTLTAIFPNMSKQEQEPGFEQGKEQSLTEKLETVLTEDPVKENKELVDDISSLINDITVLSSTDLESYINLLDLIDLQNLLDTDVPADNRVAFEAVDGVMTKLERYYESGEDNLDTLAEFILSLNNGISSVDIVKIDQSIKNVQEPIDQIVATNIYNTIEPMNGIIHPANSSSDVIEIEGDSLSVTFGGKGTLTVSFASTGSNFESHFGIKDAEGNYIEASSESTASKVEEGLDAGAYAVTGVGYKTVKYSIDTAGTYILSSPKDVTGRGCYIGSIAMKDIVDGENGQETHDDALDIAKLKEAIKADLGVVGVDTIADKSVLKEEYFKKDADGKNSNAFLSLIAAESQNVKYITINKGFEELLSNVVVALNKLSANAGEDSLIPEMYEELQTISSKYTSLDLAKKFADLYEYKVDEDNKKAETVNFVEEYETAFKKFVTENYKKNDNSNLLTLSQLVEPFNNAADTIAEDASNINAIRSSSVFDKTIYLVSSHAAETLLQYYTDSPVSFFNESGEGLLIYYLCAAPRTEADIKLGITDTLRDYYYTSQIIVREAQTIYKLTMLEAIEQDLMSMSSEINALNSLTSDKVYGWRLTSELLTALFATYLAIDLIVIVAYWVFEVFRDREKCYNMNYDLICKSLSIK